IRMPRITPLAAVPRQATSVGVVPGGGPAPPGVCGPMTSRGWAPNETIGKRATKRPHRPRGASRVSPIATTPRITRYRLPKSARVSRRPMKKRGPQTRPQPVGQRQPALRAQEGRALDGHPVAGADLLRSRDEDPEDLGDDPRADGGVGARRP